MANQIGLKLLTRPGDEVVVGAEAHIVWHESGASAANSGVQFSVAGQGGTFDAAAFAAAYKPPGHVVFPPTTLVAIENTHNRGGGVVFPQADIEAICAAARRLDVGTYLDGARLFNAAIASGRTLASTRPAVRRRLGRALQGPRLPGRQRHRRHRGGHAPRRPRPSDARRRAAPVGHPGRRRPLRAGPGLRPAGRGPRQRPRHRRARRADRGRDRHGDGADQHRHLPPARASARRRDGGAPRRRAGRSGRRLRAPHGARHHASERDGGSSAAAPARCSPASSRHPSDAGEVTLPGQAARCPSPAATAARRHPDRDPAGRPGTGT